jgi:hypothetical protein
MLYILCVNQPALTTGRPALDSRGKGHPMKANARHVPGSTRSWGSALLLNATPARHFHTFSENPYKTRTKSDPFSRMRIFNNSASTTYNFTTLKGTDFPGRGSSSLHQGESQGKGQTGSLLLWAFQRLSFSLGEKVRMRDKLVTLCSLVDAGNKLTTTVQNETKRDVLDFFREPTALYQRLTTTPSAVVPFCIEQIVGRSKAAGRKSQIRTFPDDFQFFRKPTALFRGLRRHRVCRPILDLGTSLELGAWDLEFHLRVNLCHNIPL